MKISKERLFLLSLRAQKYSNSDISKLLNEEISKSTVSNIINNKSKKHSIKTLDTISEEILKLKKSKSKSNKLLIKYCDIISQTLITVKSTRLLKSKINTYIKAKSLSQRVIIEKLKLDKALEEHGEEWKQRFKNESPELYKGSLNLKVF